MAKEIDNFDDLDIDFDEEETEEEETEEEGVDEEEVEEETPPPKTSKKSSKKAATKKSAATKEDDSDLEIDEEDEEDEEETPPPPRNTAASKKSSAKKSSTKPASKKSSAKKASSKPQSEEASLDFDEDDFEDGGMSGSVEFGESVSRFAVERLRYSEGVTQRVCVLNNKLVKFVKTHYDGDTLGRFLVIPGISPKEFDRIDIHYLVPVLCYPADQSGRVYAKGEELIEQLSIKVFAVTQANWKELGKIHEREGDIAKCDLMIECTDGTYNKLSISPTDCIWRKDSERKAISQWIKETWGAIKHDHIKCFARKVEPERFLRVVRANDAATPGGATSAASFMDND